MTALMKIVTIVVAMAVAKLLRCEQLIRATRVFVFVCGISGSVCKKGNEDKNECV